MIRQTTRRKYYGRSQAAGALRDALQGLEEAINLSQKPLDDPLPTALRKAIRGLERALEACQVYNIDRKRLRASLAREKGHLQALVDQLVALPVLPQEKLLARVKKTAAARKSLGGRGAKRRTSPARREAPRRPSPRPPAKKRKEVK